MKERLQMIPVAVDDPRRCQGVTKKGQCRMQACEGSSYCPQHNGAMHQPPPARNYHLTKFQALLDQKLTSPNIRSLIEEIGILRLMLETLINRLETPEELLMCQAQIGDLITKIEKTVVSSHKLESAMGELLDKTTLNIFASNIIKIITRVLIDKPEEITQIAEGILTLLDNVNDLKEDNDVS